MTFGNRVVKNFHPFNVTVFLTNFLQEFLVHVIIEAIENNITLWGNSNVELIDLKQAIVKLKPSNSRASGGRNHSILLANFLSACLDKTSLDE